MPLKSIYIGPYYPFRTYCHYFMIFNDNNLSENRYYLPFITTYKYNEIVNCLNLSAKYCKYIKIILFLRTFLGIDFSWISYILVRFIIFKNKISLKNIVGKYIKRMFYCSMGSRVALAVRTINKQYWSKIFKK